MFDTSLVRPRTVAAPRRFALLSASIVIHSCVAFATVVTSIASVEFPGDAPKQVDIYRPADPISLPPALGPGGPPQSKPQPQTVPPPVQKQQPQEQTAPAVVPDEMPDVEVPSANDVASTDGRGLSDGVGTGNPGGGDPLGVPGGVGNVPGGTGTGPADANGPLVPVGEVKSARVLRRVEPRYPQSMIVARIRSATVTVRCVVDRDGNVRDPEVLTSSFPPFNAAVIDAVRQWKFAPGTHRGAAVETYFELTVKFEVR